MLNSVDSEPDDLRATIEASFEPVVETPEPEVAEPEAPAETVAAEEPASIKTDHPTDPKRYADGSFKPQKEASADTAAAPKETPSTDTTKASADPASTPVSAPPAGWTAAEKAEWSKLSPVAQAAVSRREAEIANGGKQWSEEKRRYEASIAPISALARSRGVDVSEAAQRLAAAQSMLDQNPVEGLKRIAASYGVDLATLASPRAAEGSPENPQPDIAALVRQHIEPFVAPIQQRFMAEEQARQQSTVDLVTTFATSAGHEHFDAVQGELMALIPSIKGSNPAWAPEKVLQEAYDRATFANPTTRAAIQAQRETEAEAKRQEAAKQRAQAARKAGSSVTGAPSGAPATQAKDSLRAEIEAAFAGA